MPLSLPQKHQLIGVKAKIDRATKHIIDFYNAKKTFLESYPFTFSHYEDPNTGHYKVFIADIKPVPVELSLMIGDTVHNLRSALDLLACQLVKLNVGDHDCHDVYFPISENSEKFVKALKKDKIQLMGKPALDVLEELQPYKGGKLHELWVLHRLDIQDKHRLILVVPASIYSWQGKTRFVPDSPESGTNNTFDASASVPFDNVYVPRIGDPIVGVDPSYFSKGRDGEVHVHFRFEGDIAFNEPEIIQSKSALNTLRSISGTVENVVKDFEPILS